MFRLVFILATCLVLAATTGCINLPNRSSIKNKTNTISAGASGNLIDITAVNILASSAGEMYEIIGSQFDSWCQANPGGTSGQPTTCQVLVREDDGNGNITTTTRETEFVEPNLLRVFAVHGASSTATIGVYVSQVQAFSNFLPLSGSGSTGSPASITFYQRVQRYQARFVHHPINPFNGLVDLLERDRPGTLYNLYTADAGQAMQVIGIMSNVSQGDMQRYQFTFEPPTYDNFIPVNGRTSFSRWKNYLVGSAAAEFECEINSNCQQTVGANSTAFANALGWPEWEDPIINVTAIAPLPSGAPPPAPTPVPATGAVQRHLDFWLAKPGPQGQAPNSIFNVPVHAQVAPTVFSIAPPAQVVGLAQPLGFAARPVGPTNATSCPAIALPPGMMWAKVVPFCASLAPQKGLTRTTDAVGINMTSRSDIVCNPGPWDDPGASASANDAAYSTALRSFVPDCMDAVGSRQCSQRYFAPGSFGLQSGNFNNRCGGYAARIFGQTPDGQNSTCQRIDTTENLRRAGTPGAHSGDNMIRMYGAALDFTIGSTLVNVETSSWGMNWPEPAPTITPTPGVNPFASTIPRQFPGETTPPITQELDGKTAHQDCIFVVMPETIQTAQIFQQGGPGQSTCNAGPQGKYCPVVHMGINAQGIPNMDRHPSTYDPLPTQIGASAGQSIYPLCVVTRRAE